MIFVARFSMTTGKSSIHAQGCRCAQPGKGYVTTEVEAGCAVQASALYAMEEQLVARGYPMTVASPCAKAVR